MTETSTRYAIKFDQNNPNWTPDPTANALFLKAIQNHMNNLLQIRGHVFLNDVYDALGNPRTSEGVITGWFYDGDNFVEFTFTDLDESGFEIDFNVDGVIYDKLPGGTLWNPSRSTSIKE